MILAPTDVSLCAPAVQDQRVPARIRFALDAESGLNDGPAVPLLLLFVTVAEGIRPASFWATTALRTIGIGVLAGIVVGLLAGELRTTGPPVRLDRADVGGPRARRHGGGGIRVHAGAGRQRAHRCVRRRPGASTRLSGEDEPALGFAEEEGAVAATFVFFALGLVGFELLDQVTWRECAFAVLSLTVVRPLAVALA